MKTPAPAAVLASLCLLGTGFYLGRAFAPSAGETGKAPHRTLYGKGSASAGAPQNGDNAVPALPPEEAQKQMVKALKQTDYLLRWQGLTTVLAGMTEENATAIEAGMTECYTSGIKLNQETEMLQMRQGQLFGKNSLLKDLPAEPNGKVTYAPLRKMKGWSSVDPRAAREWLETLEPGRARDQLQGQWLAGLASAPPEQITALFPSLPPDQQAGVVDGLLNGLHSQGGLPAIVSWFDANKATATPQVVQSALKEMMWRMGQNLAEWDTSAEFFKRAAADGLLNRSHFDAFTRNLAGENPGRCLEFIASLPPSPALQGSVDSMIGGIVERSSATTLNNVGAWLNSHKDTPLYDQTVHQYALRMNGDDPEAAARWAGTIKDENLRNTTLAALKGQ
ncbi:MAG TPA: hypothetical protein VHM91_08850 [Verrucomicrobiales bacterium]|jgi:hypothetical protein|nr:hypothetical protein [Verrucomicrobiales bacterium]